MDSGTGLYYLRARYMDPAMATFTSMDSYAGNIYEPASLHRYLYANANPVKYCDPSGHSPLASLTTSVSQLTMLQTNALILSMATMSGLMNMAVRAVTCLVTDGRLPNGKEFGSAFLEGFYIGSLIGSLTVFVALYANLTLFEMSICMAGASTVQSVIGGAISSYKGDGVGIVINTLSAVLSAVAFSKFYGLKTETITVKSSGKANKVESKPDGTSEPQNNVPSVEAETPKVDGGSGKANFATDELLKAHYEKHGSEFKGAYNSPEEYLQGAQDVMKNGYRVKYNYKGEQRYGYVEFLGNNSKGQAKFAFVGTNNDGFITTFHTESGKSFWKMLNGTNIPVINPE